MPRSAVMELVSVLSADVGDSTHYSRFYEEATREVALALGWPLNMATIKPIAGQAVYSLPADGLQLLAMFYGSDQLFHESLLTLDLIQADWRTATGIPHSFVLEGETSLQFRLVPAPETDGDDYVFGTGDVIAEDFPDRNVLIIYLQAPVDWRPEFDLLLALLILAQEFTREAPHQDLNFAAVCRRGASALMDLLR